MSPDFRAKLTGVFGLRAAASTIPRIRMQDGFMGFAMGTVAIVFSLTYLMIFVAFSTLFIQEIVQLLMAKWQGTKSPTMALTNELGLLFAAIISAPFVVWQTVSSWRQAVTAEQRHITERLGHVAEQIWTTRRVPTVRKYDETWMAVEDEFPNIEARIAGLRELARVSDYNEAYHIAAMDTICSYLRLNAPRDTSDYKADDNELLDGSLRAFKPRPDIVVAMHILGRRSKQRRDYELFRKHWLNISHTSLRQIDMWNVKLARATLSNADFTDAYLGEADFELAWLHCSVFNRANMKDCVLKGAALPGCNMKGAFNLQYDQLTQAFGVKTGNLKTVLPEMFLEPPVDWFEPSKLDLSPSDFFDEFDVEYARFCKNKGLKFIPSR